MRPTNSPWSALSAFTRWSRLDRLREFVAELPRRAERKARPTRLTFDQLEDRVVPSGRPLQDPVIFSGTGEGPPPVVRAHNAETGELIFERTVAEPTFAGGVRVAAADFTADGWPDLVLSYGPGGGPRVQVLDGKTGDPIAGPLGSFMAYVTSFTGGVRVAAADVNADGVPDVITAAGVGGGPHV